MMIQVSAESRGSSLGALAARPKPSNAPSMVEQNASSFTALVSFSATSDASVDGGESVAVARDVSQALMNDSTAMSVLFKRVQRRLKRSASASASAVPAPCPAHSEATKACIEGAVCEFLSELELPAMIKGRNKPAPVSQPSALADSDRQFAQPHTGAVKSADDQQHMETASITAVCAKTVPSPKYCTTSPTLSSDAKHITQAQPESEGHDAAPQEAKHRLPAATTPSTPSTTTTQPPAASQKSSVLDELNSSTERTKHVVALDDDFERALYAMEASTHAASAVHSRSSSAELALMSTASRRFDSMDSTDFEQRFEDAVSASLTRAQGKAQQCTQAVASVRERPSVSTDLCKFGTDNRCKMALEGEYSDDIDSPPPADRIGKRVTFAEGEVTSTHFIREMFSPNTVRILFYTVEEEETMRNEAEQTSLDLELGDEACVGRHHNRSRSSSDDSFTPCSDLGFAEDFDDFF